MASREITELQRIFQSRLDALDHILDVGGKHLDLEAALHERLAPDMLPLGSQVALACNQPRGFSQWCGGKPVENLPWDVESVEQARAHIEQTRKLVAAIDAGADQLEQANRIGLGPGRYCELPGRQYVSEYAMPHLDRQSAVEGKRVAVRVDLGGRRIIKKKHKHLQRPKQTKNTT